MEYFNIGDDARKEVSELRYYMQCNGYNMNLPDELLYRYLVTSGHKKAPALSKILKMLSWRSQNRIDYLLQDIYAKQLTTILSRKLHFIEHGCDLLQRPLTIICIGRFHLCDILKEYSVDDILLVYHYYTEYIEQKCRQLSKELKRDYIGNVTIMDMKGLSLCKHMHPKAVAIFKAIVLINTYYYPESCQRVFVINCPPIFSFFWKLIVPFMNENQYTKLKKIQNIMRSSDELLDYFPPESLPCQYGGSCQCKSEDILFNEVNDCESPKGSLLHIPKGSTSKIDLKVEEGDHVKLSFASLETDVRYTVYLKNETTQHIYINSRVATSNMNLVNVSFIIISSGTLIIEFSTVDIHLDCNVGYELVIM